MLPRPKNWIEQQREKMLKRWQENGWYQLFVARQYTMDPARGGYWDLNRVSWDWLGDKWAMMHRQQDWGDFAMPYMQDGWSAYGRVHHLDEEYAAFRGDRNSPLTILNARFAVFEIDEQSARTLVPNATGKLRYEMILDDNTHGGGDWDPIKARIFRRAKPTTSGCSRVELCVMRRVMLARMTDESGNNLNKDSWHPKSEYSTKSTNAPHFLTQQFDVPIPGLPAEPPKTLLLDQHARQLVEQRVGGLKNLNSAWNNEGNRLTFPPTCSDAAVRTDPYTYEQETSGRTNRMSVADLTCLARPFACRQKRFLEREYGPHGEFVEKVKKLMRKEGLASDGVEASASLLPSLAGLRL